jgi:hypothetical protein
MKPAHALLLILPLCAGIVGQSANPKAKPLTSHVQGTIRDETEAAVRDIEVTFQNTTLKKTATTDGVGEYSVDLPEGRYTMDVTAPGFRRYHRPWFSVTSDANLTFDIALVLTSTCDVEVVSSSGEPAPTEAQKAAIEETCLREELLPVPQKKGAPFPLFVQYGKRTLLGHLHNYFEAQPVMDPVFVAYNLFSLEADHVTYDAWTQILDAHGHVVVVDQSSGESKVHTGDWMKFTIQNGQATPEGCVCNQFPKKYSRGRLYH